MSKGRIGYEYTHTLLKKIRGRAAEYDCVDCQGPAAHWSLSAYAEEFLYEVDTSDEGKAYSHNLDDYEPRCRKCHSAYDKKHNLMRRPEGNRSGRTRTSLMGRSGCIVPGCDNPHKAREKCAKHYAQELRKENGLVRDNRTLERVAVDDIMEYVWTACSTGADIEKVLGSMIYTCRKLRDEVRDERSG